MRRMGLLVAGLTLAAGSLVVACDGGGAADSGKGSAVSAGKSEAEAPKERRPEDDVEVTRCGMDGTGTFPQAELTVTNHSSKSSNYVISVEFVDGSGTRKAEGTAALNNLASGQAAEEKAVGLSSGVPAELKCKVTKVTRYAS
ncbi:hypothetical protein [Streptomyces sp. TE5632]